MDTYYNVISVSLGGMRLLVSSTYISAPGRKIVEATATASYGGFVAGRVDIRRYLYITYNNKDNNNNNYYYCGN